MTATFISCVIRHPCPMGSGSLYRFGRLNRITPGDFSPVCLSVLIGAKSLDRRPRHGLKPSKRKQGECDGFPHEEYRKRVKRYDEYQKRPRESSCSRNDDGKSQSHTDTTTSMM